ncbi:sugar 3,4-ketoisomerase [Nocardia noduli]|uniref:sugar 3,4-ketoisomerase n=1 Tax=Nocardia noduli TaxID=2815722 RepID=UPI0020B36A23|nr:FdtA/QdtA family cupin domain-containing protein [Nocardia noduli]
MVRSELVTGVSAISINNCKLLDFSRFSDARGALTPIEGGTDAPFDIKRIYYIYDVPNGASRAGHGHRELQQVLIAINGSFDVHVDDGSERKVFHLDRPHLGLYVAPMIWREIHLFSLGAVCVSLASAHYDESDYFRRYEDFQNAVGESS